LTPAFTIGRCFLKSKLYNILMKRNYPLLVIIVLSALVLPVFAKALSIPNPLVCGDIPCIIEVITNLIFVIGIALVPIMVILAAYNFITAGGDPKKITLARNMLLYIFIGIIVMVAAKAVTSIARSLLGG
jgi:Type IV secretion system pilin